MQVHLNRLQWEEGKTFVRYLMSDLHIGSAYADVARMKEDLEAAKKAKATIVINGDVFDAITIRDKRFMPSCIAKELQGKDDLVGAIVEMGFKILEPYADVIDVIGEGNHEQTLTRYNSEDVIARLLDKLNKSLEKQGSAHRIRHGGIMGFIRTRFCFARDGAISPSVSHTLLYQHGSGGDSPVTKGAIDFYRKGNQYDYDCMTMGHRHNRTSGEDSVVYLSPRDHLISRVRLYAQTASYLRNISRTTQKNPLAYSYAESAHHSPKPMGGWFLSLTPHRQTQVKAGKRASVYRVDQSLAMTL